MYIMLNRIITGRKGLQPEDGPAHTTTFMQSLFIVKFREPFHYISAYLKAIMSSQDSNSIPVPESNY
jgi:hypothetical protein